MIDINKFIEVREKAMNRLVNEVKRALEKQDDETFLFKEEIDNFVAITLDYKNNIVLIDNKGEKHYEWKEDTFINIAKHFSWEIDNIKVDVYYFADAICNAEENYSYGVLRKIEEDMLKEMLSVMKGKGIKVLYFNPSINWVNVSYTAIQIMENEDGEDELYVLSRNHPLLETYLMTPLSRINNDLYFMIAERINNYKI